MGLEAANFSGLAGWVLKVELWSSSFARCAKERTHTPKEV